MSLKTTNTFYDAKQKIWRGPPREYKYGPNATLGEVILENLRRNPEKVMQIMDPTGEEVTAAELLRDSKILTAYLIKAGLRPGDVVGLFASNSKNVTSLLIAALLCGTPWQAVFAEFYRDAVAEAFQITNPKIIFCDVENYEILKLVAVEMNFVGKIITINGAFEGVESVEGILNTTDLLQEEISYPCDKLNGDITAVILCTSGTTGSPKGVCCSHRTLLNSPISLNISSDSIVMSFSSYYWISGVFTFTLSLLYGATRVITPRAYSPEAFVDIIEKYCVTHMLSGTPQIAELVQNIQPDTAARLISLRAVLYGGTKVSKMIPEKLHKILSPKVEHQILYGLSEVGGMVSQTFRGADTLRYDCEGKLMPNIEAKIIDVTTNAALGANSMGQLFVRTPYKWPGYYNNEKVTNKTYVDGWINTGDIASFDNEGFLTVFERQSDIFRIYNYQIYPNNLESVILQLPGVAEVCIFPIPDALIINLIACAVVRTDNEIGKALTEDDVVKSIEGKFLSVIQLNGGVYFVDELPKTVSGKVVRRKVIEMVNNLRN